MPAVTLQPGIIEQPFVALAGTGAVKGTGYAIPPANDGQARTAQWQTISAGSALSAVLQVAQNDVDAEYATLDTAAVATGETRIVALGAARWVRINQVSRTGGTLTVNLGIT